MDTKFFGGGVTCTDTGYGTYTNLEVINAYIWSCWAGINISYWSEYNQFTNVQCEQCVVGCINNGGNNIFVNCDFSSNLEKAFVMDNKEGGSINNSHGSCIGCVFNHTAHAGFANAGIGIESFNCDSGFIFSGCQIFYSQINLIATEGIVFSNCNFGCSNCDMNISGGGTILFSDCMFQSQPNITIINNSNVHFSNCYDRQHGESIIP